MTNPRHRFPGLAALACAVVWACPPEAAAQAWPRTPVALFGGRVSVGGDLAVTYGSDDHGYFNYTDYESSRLRRAQGSLLVALATGRRVTWLAEVRTASDHGLDVYGAFIRLTPWTDRPLTIQAGKIPPVFGGFSRRGYASDNPLIGDPLVYQYLTSARRDALPATSADILRMRGRGWLSSFPVGRPGAAPGLPVIAGSEWDTGLQVRFGGRSVELTLSWTVGALSAPGPGSRPGTGTWAARVRRSWGPGFSLGISAAHGTFVDADARRALPVGSQRGGAQQTAGLDAEWASGPVQVRAEAVFNRWTMPAVTAPLPLDASALFVEARYRFHPRLYAAARAERLGFGQIAAPSGQAAWEARVSRLETGLGLSLAPRVRVKSVYQLNIRDGGRVRRNHLVAAQVLTWF